MLIKSHTAYISIYSNTDKSKLTKFQQELAKDHITWTVIYSACRSLGHHYQGRGRELDDGISDDITHRNEQGKADPSKDNIVRLSISYLGISFMGSSTKAPGTSIILPIDTEWQQN